MRIAVCDDEKVMRDTIAQRIQRFYPSYQIVKYERGEQLLEDPEENDLIFLDIQMEGMDGIETAKQLRKHNSQAVLVFLTAWEEYVFQAFDVDAFHYLVKPLKKEKFYQVLEAAVNRVKENILFQGKGEEKRSIVIKTGGTSRKIIVDEIIYVEVRNRKLTLYTWKDKIEFYGKLSELERKLGEDFIRPHRSYLIHFRYVQKYCAAEITLEDGTVILLAKQRYGEFVKQYLKYLKRSEGER
ncbi:MAG: response regulator transcription factor [Lachnospiraceae bacterium]|nr:response regulator transcription factor [Lachnospiraceae bacterium]